MYETVQTVLFNNLDMPGMTMAFAVKDKTWLDKVKTVDKIKFTVVMEGSKMVVTDLQKAP